MIIIQLEIENASMRERRRIQKLGIDIIQKKTLKSQDIHRNHKNPDNPEKSGIIRKNPEKRKQSEESGRIRKNPKT